MPRHLVLDEVRHEVRLEGKTVKLSMTEFAVLSMLMRSPRAAIRSEDILLGIRGDSWVAETSLLQVHVSRIRRKLGESASHQRFIVTVYGLGYRFEPDPATQPLEATDLADTDEDADREDSRPGPAYALLSADRTIVWASAGVHDLLGWRPEELIGRSLYALAPDRDRAQWLAVRGELDSGVPRTFTGAVRTADGGERQVLGVGRPVVDATGAVTGFLVEMSPDAEAAPDTSIAPVLLLPAGAPAQRVELEFDRDLVLRKVTPHDPFLGWEPTQIIGGFFSPTGLDEAAVRAIIASRLAMESREMAGDILVHGIDGAPVAASMSAHVKVDDDGQFAGLRTTLTFGASPGSSG